MVNAVPMSWYSNDGIVTNGVKTAIPGYIEYNDNDLIDNAELYTDILFEDISGQELLTISRNDTVNGQSIAYQPIKNLDILNQEYNPNNILALSQTFDKTFNSFAIHLSDKIPNVGNGTNGSNVYLTSTGDIVIEFVNLFSDEQIEIQMSSSGTIYEADI